MSDEGKNSGFLKKGWEFITNKNDYKRGYDDGYQDALNGKQKSYPGIASFKSLVHGDKTMETYTQGYDEGYRKGMYDKQQEKNKNMEFNDLLKNTGSNNADAQSFKRQLELLEELKNRLLNLQNAMVNINNVYRNDIEKLRNEGLVVELYNMLLNECYENTSRNLKNLAEHLNNEDIVFINKKIGELQNALTN